MKKLSQKIKDAKDWIVENPEKLAYGITGVTVISMSVVMYKLHLMDTKHKSLKSNNMPIANVRECHIDKIKDLGIIGNRILSEQPDANPNEVIPYVMIYFK